MSARCRVLLQHEPSFGFPHLGLCNCLIYKCQKSVTLNAIQIRDIILLIEMPVLHLSYRRTDCQLKLSPGRAHQDAKYGDAATEFQANLQPSIRFMKAVQKHLSSFALIKLVVAARLGSSGCTQLNRQIFDCCLHYSQRRRLSPRIRAKRCPALEEL
jgi:hypothetical protein